MMRYCDCCNKKRPVTVIHKEVSDSQKLCKEKYNIMICKKCNHSFIDPLPSEKEEIINFYPKDYYAHVKFASPQTIKAKIKLSLTRLYYGQYSGNKFVRLLEKLFYLLLNHTINEPPIIANGKLLDIGCGSGEYLNVIRQFGWDTYGIELNEKAVYIAQSAGLKVKKGSAEETRYGDSFFDVVRMWNLLEHTISPRRALSEVARILKKGGYLLVFVPNFYSVDRKYFGKYWAGIEIPRHLHHFSAKSLESYLKEAGLVIERRMYPGTIFSLLVPTMKILRNNQISMFSVVIKTITVVVRKIFNRLLGKYSGDIGICVLAKKA